MDTSPTLSIGGSRARAALLTTSGSGTGSTDRRVVFLASQPTVGSSHETKTWPHHWSPHTVCTCNHVTSHTTNAFIHYTATFEISRYSRPIRGVFSCFARISPRVIVRWSARARVCAHATNVYVRWLFKRETLGKLASTVGGRLNNGRWSVRYSSGRITGLATACYKFRFRGMFKHGRWERVGG